MAAAKSRQGQNVRDKFFMDFASATAKSSDPFGQQQQRKTDGLDWLPALSFIEAEPPVDSSIMLNDSIFELRAMFEQGGFACQ